MDQLYYVYGHYNHDELVYVGKGQGGRILSTSSRHNKHHLRFIIERLNAGDVSFAKLLHSGLTEETALDIERSLIVQHQPAYNKKMTEKELERARSIALNASRASMRQVATPSGVFESISEASRHYGVTPGAIWHRIKDNPTEYYYLKDKNEEEIAV